MLFKIIFKSTTIFPTPVFAIDDKDFNFSIFNLVGKTNALKRIITSWFPEDNFKRHYRSIKILLRHRNVHIDFPLARYPQSARAPMEDDYVFSENRDQFLFYYLKLFFGRHIVRKYLNAVSIIKVSKPLFLFGCNHYFSAFSFG